MNSARNKRITIKESELVAKELLAAAERLEARYPALKAFSSSISSVRQRYEAVCERVSRSELDRKGSLIGGAPFLSADYPNLDMAPLVQLDLDEILKATGERVGTGLLQVWMPCDIWGQEPYLGDLHIRVVPREVVDHTTDLEAGPDFVDEEWLAKKEAEHEILEIVDPRRAAEDEEIYMDHYWSGSAGFDWTLSEFSDSEDSTALGNCGAPQQITDWQPAGFTIPPGTNYGCLWNWDDIEIEKSIPSLFEDPDYKTICGILSRWSEGPRCALFDVYSDFYGTVYGSESWYGKGSADWNWRPLFAFPGPLSRRVSDEHMVFYREVGDEFEYAGACMRWNWH